MGGLCLPPLWGPLIICNHIYIYINSSPYIHIYACIHIMKHIAPFIFLWECKAQLVGWKGASVSVFWCQKCPLMLMTSKQRKGAEVHPPPLRWTKLEFSLMKLQVIWSWWQFSFDYEPNVTRVSRMMLLSIWEETEIWLCECIGGVYTV